MAKLVTALGSSRVVFAEVVCSIKGATFPIAGEATEPGRLAHSELRRQHVVQIPAQKRERECVEHHHAENYDHRDVVNFQVNRAPGYPDLTALKLGQQLNARAESTIWK